MRSLFIRIVLYVIAAVLLGAHFLRSGDYWLVGLCAATPLCFLKKSPWSLILLQIGAYCGAIIWIATAFQLVAERQQEGRPSTAAVIILGAVALFSLMSGLLLNSQLVRDRYRSGS